jgi:arylsulfatase A-like enzyme
MRWPGVIPEGSVNNEITGIIDMLPTFCGLAGVEVPSDRIIDGRDIRPYMEGKKVDTPIHDTFIVPGKTVRYNEWKLLVASQKPGGSVKPGRGVQGRLPSEAGSLFNLEDDPGESKNVAANHPEKVEELKKMMDSFMKELETNSRPIGKVEGFVPPEKKKKK